jgi:hypothetical protein
MRAHFLYTSELSIMASQLENFGNILAYVCEHERPIKYKIRNRAGKVGSTSILPDNINKLEQLGHIRISSEEGVYAITQSGFVIYLGICARLGKDRLHTQVNFTNLARRAPNLLPRIFKLWKNLRKQRVDDIAEKLIIDLAGQNDAGLPGTPHAKKFLNSLPSKELLEEIAKVIEIKFFDLDNLVYKFTLNRSEKERWDHALSNERDLSRPFRDRLKSKNFWDDMFIELRKAQNRRFTNDARLEKAKDKDQKLKRGLKPKTQREVSPIGKK